MILTDVLFFIIGLCLYLWAQEITNLISIIIGVIFILYGILMVIYYFKNKDGDTLSNFKLIYGIFAFVFGMILVTRTSFLKELISFVIGIYIVLASIFKMQESLRLKDVYIGYKKPLILSVIGLVIGILCIIGKFIVPDFINMIIGLVLMLYSFIDIINIIIIDTKK